MWGNVTQELPQCGSSCDESRRNSCNSFKSSWHCISIRLYRHYVCSKASFHPCHCEPERAKRLIGPVADILSDRCTIVHIDNRESIDEVEAKMKKHMPDVLVESHNSGLFMRQEARLTQMLGIVQCVRCGPMKRLNRLMRSPAHAIPTDLQVKRDSDATVEYLSEKVPSLVDG
ncbi:hypothetical protein N7486_006114 [Penicillium sp. IBT 16267x]|nr:hypothetical protein N7486_006114 [Penicillium sp. IBT 16267x]